MTVICFAIGRNEIALGADSRAFNDDGTYWRDDAVKLAVAEGGILSVAGLSIIAADSPGRGPAPNELGESPWLYWTDLAERILWNPVPVPARIRWELHDERILEVCQRALELEKYATDGVLCRDVNQDVPCAVTPITSDQEVWTVLTTGWVDPEGVCWLQQTAASVLDDRAFVDGRWMRGTGGAPMLFAQGPDQEATRQLNNWIDSEPYLLELLALPGGAAEVAEEVIRTSLNLLADHAYPPGGRARSVSLRPRRSFRRR